MNKIIPSIKTFSAKTSSKIPRKNWDLFRINKQVEICNRNIREYNNENLLRNEETFTQIKEIMKRDNENLKTILYCNNLLVLFSLSGIAYFM